MANEIVDAFDAAFPDYNIEGLPSSGAAEPRKALIRAAGEVIQDEVDLVKAGQQGGFIVYATWSELDAHPTTDLYTGAAAQVTDDAGTHTDPVNSATVDNEGIYSYVDPTGWERVASRNPLDQTAVVSEIPANVVDGDRVVWEPTREVATWDDVSGIFRRGDGSPLCTVFEDFSGAVARLDQRPIPGWRPGGGDPETMEWMHVSTAHYWSTDGAGAAAPNDAGNSPLRNIMLVQAGCADRLIYAGIVPGAGAFSGLIVTGDGRRYVRCYVSSARLFNIEQIDITTDVAWTVIATATLPSSGFSATAQRDIMVALEGNTITATDIASATVISGDKTLTTMPHCGVQANNTASRVNYLYVYPLDTANGVDRNGVTYRGARTIRRMRDPDGFGLWVHPVTGRRWLLCCASTNGNGEVAGVYLEEEIAQGVFKRHTVDENPGPADTSKFTKIEGACFVDIDGDGWPELAIMDQGAGDIFLYKVADPNRFGRNWSRVRANAVHANRWAGQDCFAFDLDGDGVEELVYAYQGSGAGSGGVGWIDWTGGDPLLTASYTDHTLCQKEGAWSFVKSRKFLDLDADNIADELVFTCRYNDRNFAAAPGVYSAKRPATVTDPWTVTTIYLAGATEDLAWVDSGDFSGDGNGKDLVIGVNQTTTINYLRYSAAWSVNAITSPSISGNAIFNTIAFNHENLSRTGLIVPVAFQGFYLVAWDGAAWVAKLLNGIDYDHPNEKPFVPIFDFRGDGGLCVFHADSDGERVFYHEFAPPTV